MTSSKKTGEIKKWYDEPIKRTLAIITGFIFVASLGYGFAVIQKNLEFRMEKYELKQEFNEKLQQQIINCEAEKQNMENKRVEAIETIVKELQKNYNEKSKLH